MRSATLGLFVGIALIGPIAQGSPFTLYQVSIQPNSSIAPSAGAFVTQFPGDENHFLDGSTLYGAVVDNTSPNTWDPSDLRPYVDDTTYLTMDPQGPSNFQGLAGGFPAPKWAYVLGGAGLDPGTDPNDGLAWMYQGGPAGLAWAADVASGFMADSEPTMINGVMKDSLFIGQLVVNTPGIPIVGAPLLITVDRGSGIEDLFVPLDGSYIEMRGEESVPFQLNFVREPAGEFAPEGSERILMYVAPVPGPGAVGMAGLGVLWMGMRRRRG